MPSKDSSWSPAEDFNWYHTEGEDIFRNPSKYSSWNLMKKCVRNMEYFSRNFTENSVWVAGATQPLGISLKKNSMEKLFWKSKKAFPGVPRKVPPANSWRISPGILRKKIYRLFTEEAFENLSDDFPWNPTEDLSRNLRKVFCSNVAVNFCRNLNEFSAWNPTEHLFWSSTEFLLGITLCSSFPLSKYSLSKNFRNGLINL